MSLTADDLGERTAMVLSRSHGRVSTLARATGIPTATLAALVQGGRPAVTLTELWAMLRALRCSPDWLLGLSSDGAPPYAELRRDFTSIFALERRRPVLPPDGRRSPQGLRSMSIVAVARQLQAREERRQAQQATAASRLHGHHPAQVPAETRDIGARIAKLLAEAGIARTELARVTGLPEGAVDELCRGRRKSIDAREIAVFAKTLGCTVSWLLGLEGEAPSVACVWVTFAARGGQRPMRRSDAAQFVRGPEDLVQLKDPGPSSGA